MKSLSQKEMDTQDAVDNEIYNLINNLAPSEYFEGKSLEYDSEIIGELRDCLLNIYIKLLNIPGLSKKANEFEMKFYPYL